MRSVLLFFLLLSLVAADEFAVLVAGSNSYWNYRHQADICHAYHVLISHGFNPDNIVLFSYDDVPSDPLNPFPGQLFNHPGNNSRDVNEGCLKDYTGEAVNVTNFLAVLKGNSEEVKGGNGKVLTSGPNDNVFINFVDHGAPGLISFPDTYLYADQLNLTLAYMWQHNKYNTLVFYLESCESGSMFHTILPPNTNTLATTAANYNQSSMATYCDSNSTVNGVNLDTCLGDLYSVNWMENCDSLPSLSKETLYEQYLTVKMLTTESDVMWYGNGSRFDNSLSSFMGAGIASNHPVLSVPKGNWDAYDVKLQTLSLIYQHNPTDDNRKAWETEIAYRARIQAEFELISTYLDPAGEEMLLEGLEEVRDFECLRGSVEMFELQCGRLQDYALQYVQVLVNACEAGHSLAQMNYAFSQACGSPNSAELTLE